MKVFLSLIKTSLPSDSEEVWFGNVQRVDLKNSKDVTV